jgi:hypothetical protein
MDENVQVKKEEIELSFAGLDADRGTIDARDLVKAIYGWCDLWEITISALYRKELSLKPLPPDMRPKFSIKALRYATFDVRTDILLPLGVMITYDFLKVLWKWQMALIKEHIANKKTLTTKEHAVENIKKVAKSFDIESKDILDSVNFVDSVDDALVSFVQPIDASSKTIGIVQLSTRDKIVFSHNDKLALTGGYHLDPGGAARQLERFKVKFLRIHIDTGKAIITFDEPNDIYKKGRPFAEIVDPKVHKLKNEYSRAFYEGTSLEVWGRKSFSKSSNKFQHWEISTDLPYSDSPLFDKKKN